MSVALFLQSISFDTSDSRFDMTTFFPTMLVTQLGGQEP